MDYYCKCGASFAIIQSLKQHWNDPERGPGPHYRVNADGSDYIPRSKWSEPDSQIERKYGQK